MQATDDTVVELEGVTKKIRGKRLSIICRSACGAGKSMASSAQTGQEDDDDPHDRRADVHDVGTNPD